MVHNIGKYFIVGVKPSICDLHTGWRSAVSFELWGTLVRWRSAVSFELWGTLVPWGKSALDK